MGARRFWAGAAGCMLMFALFAIAPSASNAAQLPFATCPSGAQSWVTNGATSYPPFATQGSDSASGLNGCTSPFTPTQGEQDVTMSFPFAQLPTDPCNVIVSATVTSTGTPGGAGWGFVAYNVDDPTIHYTGPSGTGDGGYQQFDAAQGNLLNTNGANFYSPIAQPSDGEYSVAYQLDPTQLDLATLAAGKLGVAAVVFDPGDVLSQMSVQVVFDDSACTPTSSSSTTSSTAASTSSTAATEVVQTTTKPTFTG